MNSALARHIRFTIRFVQAMFSLVAVIFLVTAATCLFDRCTAYDYETAGLGVGVAVFGFGMVTALGWGMTRALAARPEDDGKAGDPAAGD